MRLNRFMKWPKFCRPVCALPSNPTKNRICSKRIIFHNQIRRISGSRAVGMSGRPKSGAIPAPGLEIPELSPGFTSCRIHTSRRSAWHLCRALARGRDGSPIVARRSVAAANRAKGGEQTFNRELSRRARWCHRGPPPRPVLRRIPRGCAVESFG